MALKSIPDGEKPLVYRSRVRVRTRITARGSKSQGSEDQGSET